MMDIEGDIIPACAGLCFIGACAFYVYLTHLLIDERKWRITNFDNGEEE